jgi:hypothetical protein
MLIARSVHSSKLEACLESSIGVSPVIRIIFGCSSGTLLPLSREEDAPAEWRGYS